MDQGQLQVVHAASSSGGSLTLTIPAPANGQGKNAITRLEIWRSSSAAVAGSAILDITTTNLPGSLAWKVGNAIAAGQTIKDIDTFFDNPLVGSTGLASTIVLPAAGTGVYWSATAYYFETS